MNSTVRVQKFLHFIAVAIIVAFCVNIYLLNVQRNFSIPLLTLMFLSPVFIIACFPVVIYKEFSLYVMYALMWGTAFAHLSSFRFSTIAYSGLFISIFILYRRLLYSNVLSLNTFTNILMRIVYAYAVVFLFQQILTILGLPVFNKCWDFTNPFKLNSLALEPSYVGPTITLLMYVFFELEKNYEKISCFKDSFYKNRWLWISYFYISLTCGSSLTLIVTTFFVLYLIDLKRRLDIVLVGVPIISCALLYMSESLMQSEVFYRMIKIVPAILSGDVQNIIATDLSASARLAPPLMYLDWIDFSNLNFLFGKGIDYSKNTLIVLLLGTDEYMEQGSATGGFFPAFFWDYGFITGVVFLWNLKKFALKNFLSFPFVLWIVGFMPVGFNTALQWMFFVIMTSLHYFEKCMISFEGKKE